MKRSFVRTLAALLAMGPMALVGRAGAADPPGSVTTLTGDVPLVGDWDGDGTDTVGVWRRGEFFLRNANSSGGTDITFFYGSTDDVPLVGDWDGNGTDTPAVWRKGEWFLRNSNSGGVADATFFYGSTDDVPLVGDWDGNGTDTPAVWRKGEWFLRNSSSGGVADARYFYGSTDDVPLVGDWDGDGTDTPGVWRKGEFFLRNTNTGGVADATFFYGSTDDIPLVGDWDGDGTTTIGIRRGSSFFLRNTNSGGVADVSFAYGNPTGVSGPPPSTPPAAVPNVAVTSVLGGLDHPWDLAFAADGTMVVTERPGRISVRLPDGTVRQLAADLSDLFVAGETGLMSIELDPDFATNRRLYTCQGEVGPSVQVVAWVADPGWTRLDRVGDDLVGGLPATSGRHGGCRLRFGPEGALYVGTGDAADSNNPQSLSSFGGKVLRVDGATGGPVAGNPFIGDPVNDSRIYTYGHRNVQGLAVRPGTGQVWEAEHGPTRDDEINLLQAGGNYGWAPGPGYDESVPMTFAGGVPAKWSSGAPTVATSGATFLVGSAWGAWQGALAVAELRGAALEVFQLQGDTIVASTKPAALAGTFGRLRTPRLGPDGSLYITTDNGGGNDQVLRVTPT